MLFDILLISVLAVCLITDLKVQRIYNKVLFPALIAALLFHVAINGLSGLKLSLSGLAVGFLVLLIPYFMGGIGAGDVKLLAVIGAIKGSIFVINSALFMAILGGFISIAIIITHRETISFCKGMTTWLLTLSGGLRCRPVLPTTVFLKKFPYGAAIVGGALISLLFKGAWII